MRTKLAFVTLAAAVVALAPTAPASARCDEDTPCGTACDKAEAKYDEVTRKFGIPLPPFPADCPRT